MLRLRPTQIDGCIRLEIPEKDIEAFEPPRHPRPGSSSLCDPPNQPQPHQKAYKGWINPVLSVVRSRLVGQNAALSV